MFLVDFFDPRYGDIIFYLQAQTFLLDTSESDQQWIWYQACQYIIISDTLYRPGIYSIFQHCLTHEEVHKILNNFHDGACGGHISVMWPPKIFYVLVISRPPCFMIILWKSRNVMHVIFIIRKPMLHLLLLGPCNFSDWQDQIQQG